MLSMIMTEWIDLFPLQISVLFLLVPYFASMDVIALYLFIIFIRFVIVFPSFMLIILRLILNLFHFNETGHQIQN